MKKISKKCIITILILSIIIQILSVCAIDVSKDNYVVDNEHSALEKDKISFLKIPEVNLQDQELIKKVDERIDTSKDELNVIRYKMKDGSYCLKAYDIPVKYVDSNGITKDKSNKVIENVNQDELNTKFSNVDNDVKVGFSEIIKDGIYVNYKEYKIKMYPVNQSESYANISDDSYSVKYHGVFGNNTSVEYKPTFLGLKEDIILDSYNGINSFSFIIETEQLILKQENDSCYFINEKDEAVARLGDIIIKDSNNNYEVGAIEINKIGNQKYYIEINVPEEYLLSNNTNYPVYIDPAIYYEPGIWYGNYNMIDATVDSFKASSGGTILHTDPYLYLGLTGTTTTNRIVVKFPNLMYLLSNISKNNITSCSYEITDTGASSWEGGSINLHPMIVPWEHTFYKTPSEYSNIYNGCGSAISSIDHSSNTTMKYRLYFTNLVKLWKDGQYTSNGESWGFMLQLDSSSNYASFYSANYTGSSSDLPHIIVNYNETQTYGIKSGALYKLAPLISKSQVSNYFMTKVSSNTVIKSEDGSNVGDPNQLFKITYIGPGYIIQNGGLYLKNSSGALTWSTTDDGMNTRWFIVKTSDGYKISSYYNNLTAKTPNTEHTNVNSPLYSTGLGSIWKLSLFDLDITRYRQIDHAACGLASSIMILKYILGNQFYVPMGDITYTNTFEQIMIGRYCTENAVDGVEILWSEPKSVTRYQKLIHNIFLNDYGRDLYDNTYFVFDESLVGTEDDNEENYYKHELKIQTLLNNINNGYPVMVHITSNDSAAKPYFQHNVGGHLVVVYGVYYSNVLNDYVCIIADPHYNNNYPTQVIIPWDNLDQILKSSTGVRNKYK